MYQKNLLYETRFFHRYCVFNRLAFTTLINWNRTETPDKFLTPNPGANPVIALRKVKLKPDMSQPTIEAFVAKVGSDEYGVIAGIKM